MHIAPHPPVHALAGKGGTTVSARGDGGELSGAVGEEGNLYRPCFPHFLFSFHFISSHAYCVMGVFIFRGKDFFLYSNGYALLFSACVSLGRGYFVESEDRNSHMGSCDVLLPFAFCLRVPRLSVAYVHVMIPYEFSIFFPFFFGSFDDTRFSLSLK